MRRPVGIMDFKLFQSQLIHEGGVFFFFFASGKESASSAVHSFDWQLFSYGGSSHIVGQDCASLGCYSDICDPHSNVWRGKGGDLTHDETTIITRAHDLTLKTAKDAMTPISKAFSLNLDATLNLDTLNAIMTMGHSRVPVYAGDPKNIIGLILVKNLLVLDPEGAVPLRKMILRKIPQIKIKMHASQEKASNSVASTVTPTSTLSAGPTPTLSVSTGTSLAGSPATTDQVSEVD
ncbi:hypothetical protein GH714_006033 [Hevea brasiliensis]|uniref:CBS domain-containing protein n=1 Tax=Hevea brasiliensis TaxID=3981 RepID=A0A6A6MCN1_HEVBR|nr:hypothetical protein GH714_006033 [Hevea brasiliensis]